MMVNGAYHVINFSRESIRSRGFTLHLSEKNGIPTLGLDYQEKTLSFCLVTGLNLNYIQEDLAEGLVSLSDEADFYPGIGTLNTPVFSLPFPIYGETLNLHCGILTDEMIKAFHLLQNEGLLGAQFFADRQVHLSFIHQELYL